MKFGRVQSIHLLGQDDGGDVNSATVSFVDIRSATKARSADHRLEDRTLRTDYYDPSAGVPGCNSVGGGGGCSGGGGTTGASTGCAAVPNGGAVSGAQCGGSGGGTGANILNSSGGNSVAANGNGEFLRSPRYGHGLSP
ncbi:unnamed protein product [Darwinula stevensoni]|uniref:Uncharacterized protein n=1 Tax=Darwinula stevensoni TaxID=69355 RepID=A0A7R8X152_9CRUS|nr:unnamed protein product [Darwinula stevensoni]CAG0882412.1 unnamed protein product [Darwinula stevensoni]